LVVVPVSDVDKAKEFYAGQLGFVVDHDTVVNDDMRVVQLTPPGSGCSIAIGTGMSGMEPGSLKGLQLVVADLRAAHAQLTERGVAVSDIVVLGGPAGSSPAPDADPLDNSGFVYFADPDGNAWAVQQISSRAAEHVPAGTP
jgi:catechol 2,3-dioxygenase-like lactoylglutathione lyase family enzyme